MCLELNSSGVSTSRGHAAEISERGSSTHLVVRVPGPLVHRCAMQAIDGELISISKLAAKIAVDMGIGEAQVVVRPLPGTVIEVAAPVFALGQKRLLQGAHFT